MENTYIICPKCGQMNDSISIDCYKCGIVYSKYYGTLAKDEADDVKRSKLLKMQEEEEARTEAIRKQKEEEARAEALRKQKEVEARTEALRKQEEEEAKKHQKRIDDIIDELKPKNKIKDLLKKYEGEMIGINYDNPSEISGANLVKVGDDIFSIIIDNDLIKSFPLRNIMSITEGKNGISIDKMEGKSHFSIIIEVYHPVYK